MSESVARSTFQTDDDDDDDDNVFEDASPPSHPGSYFESSKNCHFGVMSFIQGKLLRGRLSTVDVLMKVVFCEKKKHQKIYLQKAARISWLAQGDQQY